MTTHQFPKAKASEPGPGVLGLVCGEQARWSQFVMAMMYLQAPTGSFPCIDPGIDITRQSNNFVRATLKAPEMEWLWIIGDDHVFHPNTIMKLLEHDVDIVVPNVLQRSAPFHPVVYKGIREEDGHHLVYHDLPRSGLHEVFAAGSAGMLIRRRVLEEVGEEPFTRSANIQNEDLAFCARARTAGFKIHIDLDLPMAHIGSMVVWPKWSDQYGWGATLDIGPVDGKGNVPSMPVYRIHEGASALVAG